MLSLVLASVCIVLHSSCVQANEVTHMPYVEELTLAPNIVKAIQDGETKKIQGCVDNMQTLLKEAMNMLDNGIERTSHKADGGVRLHDLTPCSQCRILNNDFKLCKVNDLIMYKYLEDSYILDAYLGFSKIHLECYTCDLTDDGGKQHSGNIDLVWTEPRINILAEDVNEFTANGTWVKFLRFNATNVNTNTVQATCKGDDEMFKEVCKHSHESGELDRIMHAASERLFKVAPNDISDEIMIVNMLTTFMGKIHMAFSCSSVPEL